MRNTPAVHIDPDEIAVATVLPRSYRITHVIKRSRKLSTCGYKYVLSHGEQDASTVPLFRYSGPSQGRMATHGLHTW